MTERVTHAELLGFRRELLESIPLALRERLKDIDHLLGWPGNEPIPIGREELTDPEARANELSYWFGWLQYSDDTATLRSLMRRRIAELEEAADEPGAGTRSLPVRESP